MFNFKALFLLVCLLVYAWIGVCYVQAPTTITETVDIPISIEVIELSFTSDHDIAGISDPVWKKTNNPNNPACYTKESNLVMEVKLTISPSVPSSATISLKAEGPGDLDAQKDSISISGSEAPVTGITTTGKLDNKIYTTSPSFTWSFSLDGTNWASAGSSGPHKIYSVYGDKKCPDSEYTASHIDYSVAWGTGSGDDPSEDDVAVKVHNNTINNFAYVYLSNPWDLLTTPGDCDTHANLMRSAMEILGIDASTSRIYPPSPTTRSPCPTNPTHTSGASGYGTYEMKFFKYDNTSGTTNWQGVCVVNSTYYDVLGTRAYGTYAQMSDPDDDSTPADFANDVIDNDLRWDYEYNGTWYLCETIP